jgi:hypothetical protein
MPASFGCRDCGADARDNLERNTGHGQRQRLLGAAAENERIATLQPDNALSCTRGANHQPVNRVLSNAFPMRALSDAEALTIGEPPQRGGIHERVVEDEIGLFEINNGALCPQLGIARSGAHERDLRPLCGLDLGFGIWDLLS